MQFTSSRCCVLAEPQARGAGYIETDIGSALVAYSAAIGSANFYLPFVDAKQLMNKGAIDF